MGWLVTVIATWHRVGVSITGIGVVTVVAGTVVFVTLVTGTVMLLL